LDEQEEDSFVLVSLNMNYYMRQFNVIHNLESEKLKKERIIKNFITDIINEKKYDLIACQEVPQNKDKKDSLVYDTGINFALDFKAIGYIYSDFLISKKRRKAISFEIILHETNSLREYIWRQVYYKYGFVYDSNCDKEFPTGYMSECYCKFKGTKIRVINFHRPKSSPFNNRFLPFTLFLISYLKAIQETYKNIGIILLGDFNGDENKEGNKEFFKTLKNELNISEVKDKEEKDTHFDKNWGNGQKLDHVFASDVIWDKFILNLKVEESVNLFVSKPNMEKAFTDHSALILTLEPKTKSE